MAAAGYTEREFYVEGKANRYRGVLPDTVTTGQIIDGNWPYRTRVLVRAPKTEKFNGFLVVEWANVTAAGQDVDFAFAESYKYLLREGYAVAVVSAQRVGVHDRLKTWSPERLARCRSRPISPTRKAAEKSMIAARRSLARAIPCRGTSSRRFQGAEGQRR